MPNDIEPLQTAELRATALRWVRRVMTAEQSLQEANRGSHGATIHTQDYVDLCFAMHLDPATARPH